MTTFVSVIIPVYNDQQGLEACLAALATQTWPQDQFEAIIVDNGSQPPIHIAPSHAKQVRLERCLTPGSYAARNVGIAAAKGDILAFTDADCVPDQNWISAGVAALKQAHGRSIIGGEVSLTLSEKPTAVERYQYLTGFWQRENIERLGFTATANLFATRPQIDQIGPFNEKLLSGGDREWSWRAASKGFPVRHAPEALVYTAPRTSLMGAIRQARRVAGGRRTLRRLGLTHATITGLKPHRSLYSSLHWILTHPELTLWQRCQVLVVASILKIIHMIETTRLSLGTRLERR